MNDSDSILRKLQDSGETVANPADDVRGRNVVDNGGTKVGTVDGLMIDDAQKKVRFLRVEAGGFLGLGATHLMIPVDAISRITDDEVTIDRSGDHLKGAPRYDPALAAELDEGYWGGVSTYYGFMPYWGLGYRYPLYPYYTPR